MEPVRTRRAVVAGAIALAGAGSYVLVLRGGLVLDLSVGRRFRPLGPLTTRIGAPRDVVFEVLSAPYLRRTPRALERKLRVVERSDGMVLAAHFTPVRKGLVATTLETVRFEPPDQIHFRLVRGPVPHVVERFVLRAEGAETVLEYTGELGTDLWALGRLWGAAVARKWEAAVSSSLAAVKVEAERRAAHS